MTSPRKPDWDGSQLRPYANLPWPMEPLALVTLIQHGPEALSAGRPQKASQVRGSIGVVALDGPMYPETTEAFADNVLSAMDDPTIGAVVMAVNSPGGVISSVPEAAESILSMRGKKPLVAVSTGMMASAAYWVASTADTIISSPSGYTGSIGVWTMHADISKMLADMGVNVSLISAGKHKVEGNMFEPLSDEARASIQGDVDDAYEQFVKAVATHRGVSAGDVRKGYGEGRVLSAQRAKEAGLVDRVETLGSVIGRLAGSAKPSGRNAGILRRKLGLDAA